MKKKYYIWIILLFIVTISQAAPSIKDSLQNILQKTKEPTQRAELLINILDLSDSSPDELEIARKVYTEGKKADDKMAIGASLSTLTIHYMQDPEKKEFYHWQVKNGKGFHFQIEEEKWQQGNRQFEEIEEI